MITAIDRGKNNLLGFTMGGKLTDEDYRKFIAIFEAAIASSGKISLLQPRTTKTRRQEGEKPWQS